MSKSPYRASGKGDKGRNPDYRQISVFVTDDIHTKFKLMCLHRGVPLRDAVEELIVAYVDEEYDTLAYEMMSEIK
ncbi:MAG: hypothetical protein ACRC7S_16445 [Cetobacterium sp.]